MRLRVLGAYGASDATHNLTGYLIDDRIAVDAGTLTSKLSLAQQSKIEVIFLTHAHADHIRDLPHLMHNRFNQNTQPFTPLIVLAVEEVMVNLQQHVFNGQVWPDFARFPAPMTGKSAVLYRGLPAGKRTVINGVAFTAVPVSHSVAAAGVIVEMDSQSIVFTGDTGPTRDIWKRANKAESVVAIITEASFPNDFQQMADDSGHLSPNTLATELGKIEVDVPVYASHRKLPWERKIESEIKNIRDRRARILVEKQYTF